MTAEMSPSKCDAACPNENKVSGGAFTTLSDIVGNTSATRL